MAADKRKNLFFFELKVGFLAGDKSIQLFRKQIQRDHRIHQNHIYRFSKLTG